MKRMIKKMTKKGAQAVFLFGGAALLLCGCSGVEPEKRLYPLVMSVDYVDSQYRVSYGMADLPGATGQEKPEEGEDPGNVSLSGRDFQRSRRSMTGVRKNIWM